MAKKTKFDVTVLFKGVFATSSVQAQRKVRRLVRYKQRKKQKISLYIDKINPFRQ